MAILNTMTLSILHISDLHRDPDNPIGNDMLLDSLRRDRDKYTSGEEPRIPAPNFIVVSGDIVQGVQHGTPNAVHLLKRQYDEALAFLNALADAVVEGDKERVVIVPGNHDVSNEAFRQSVTRVDVNPDTRKAVVGELFCFDSPLRWSWDELTLYKISDSAAYERRLAAFSEFYGTFYEGKRSYPLEPSRQLDVFDCPEFDVAVVAFSSCYNNDLLNRQGTIHPDCIAKAGSRLREISLSHDPVRIAVWHHKTEGPPSKSDYMDPDTVQNLIDSGFSLGFHGHQHRPEFLDMRFRHGPVRRITVISAGTLCGGADFRHGRAYNVVEIDTTDRTGRLHLREMQNDRLHMPIFGPRALPPNQTSYLEFTFDAPPQPFVRPDRNTVLLNEAQTLYDTGNFRQAADKLAPLATADPLARRLLLECYLRLDDAHAIVTTFDPPESPAEVIALMDALWHLELRPRLGDVIKLPLVAESTDCAVIEMRDKYAARVKK